MRAAKRLVLRLSVLATVATVATAACATGTTEPPLTSSAVLEVQYVNFAWFPTWKGFVIDSAGGVYSFDLAGKQWAVADPEHPTRAELAAKYASGRTLVRTLPASEARELFALVREAAAGSVTSPVNRCADAGYLTYSAYQATAGERSERILLRAEGDEIRDNRASAARQLARRLASLGLMTPIEGCQPEAG